MSRPIQLHADLSIDPAREAEAIDYFETVTAHGKRFEGYIRPAAAEASGRARRLGPRRHQLPVLDHLHQRDAASTVGCVGAARLGEARDVCDETRVPFLLFEVI